jgi:glycosyltransferase involved in cell wall biosynthesis
LPSEKFLFLFAGQIRPYKGVLELVEAFKSLDPEVKKHCLLVVAGKASDASYLKRIEEAMRGGEEILFFHRFLEEEELLAFVAACDVGVLPYRDVLNSGSALLFSSLGIPVVGPKIGALPEVVEALQEGVLYEENALRESLHKAFERYRGKEVREKIVERTKFFFSPEKTGKLHFELYEKILKRFEHQGKSYSR